MSPSKDQFFTCTVSCMGGLGVDIVINYHALLHFARNEMLCDLQISCHQLAQDALKGYPLESLFTFRLRAEEYE